MAPELRQGKKQTCRAQAALKPLLPRDSLTVVTRNVVDFQLFEVQLLNPFSQGATAS